MAYKVIGPNLVANPNFLIWPHGDVVSGEDGPGRETAAAWISKWSGYPQSRGACVRIPGGGLKYNFVPYLPYETYYLRQTYHNLQWALNKTFRLTFNLKAHQKGVYGIWYINARWNNSSANRISIVNTSNQNGKTTTNPSGSIPGLLPLTLTTYTVDFTMPGAHAWSITESQGIEFAFLFATAVKNSSVYVTNSTLHQLIRV